MSKKTPSGPAIFMYSVIAATALVSLVSFYLYYLCKYESTYLLWSGIVAFMIMYHLWLRIIMGNVTKFFKLDANMMWFKERSFEKHIYEFLRVKKWKGKALTYNPELFSLKDHTYTQIANTMTKAETDHWINELISLSALLFALLWGKFWIFLVTSVAAMLFDGQFILIQRYNRPRMLRLAAKQDKILSKEKLSV